MPLLRFTDEKSARINNELAMQFIQTHGYTIDDVIKRRVATAISFYRTHGFNNPESDKIQMFKEIAGIDFMHEVQIIKVDAGTLFDQMQDSGYGTGEIRQGLYYAYHNTDTPDEATLRGIADSTIKKYEGHEMDDIVYSADKQVTLFTATEKMEVLVSVAKSVSDTWSMWMDGKPIEVETLGGGAQVYVGRDGNTHLKSEHQINFDTILHRIQTIDFATTLTPKDRNIIVKELYILKSKIDFKNSKNIGIENEVKQLDSLVNALQRDITPDQITHDESTHGAGMGLESIIALAEQIQKDLHQPLRP